ncbi:MFS transporter [Salinicola rhizosphaerae]|uniref:MFS transporter n=1 Tax=Salinicola rhizosphaerae TaxID=1443141 RepID=A0ABQ3E9X5_9GAMM|nr:MFS transporter [Salinicola rhizosphaerae]GHB25707.1 MFS transporter [Salinicola rhizosphaerae]
MSRHTNSTSSSSSLQSSSAHAANQQLEQEAAVIESGFIERGKPGYRPTMLALFLGAFSTFVLLYCVQPLMPILSEAFDIDAATSSLSLSVATGMLAVGLLITGPISDALGRKSVMSVALLAAAIFSLLAAAMPSWSGVLVLRALVGLSLSGLCAVAMTYLNEEIDPRYVGLSMGLYISGNSIGGMSGRLISGVMVDWVPWRWTLAVIGIVALVAAVLFIRWLPPSKHFTPRPLNWRNVLSGFAVHFRDRGMPFLFLEAFLLMGGFVTLYNYIAYRLLAEPYSVSQALVGVLSIAYLSGTWSSAWAGSLADRHGRQRIFWLFIVMMLVGLAVTLFSPISLILIGILIFTFGFFAAHSLASGWVGQRATQAKGQASSLYLFSYYLGSSVAGTLGGAFWYWGGWHGVAAFIAVLLLAALAVGALHLRRLA